MNEATKSGHTFELIFVVALTVLFVALAIKPGDEGGLVDIGDLTIQINYSPILIWLRGGSPTLVIVSSLVILICCLRSIRATFRYELWYALAQACYEIRLYAQSGDPKYLAALMFLGFLLVICNAIADVDNFRMMLSLPTVSAGSMFLFSAAMIVINALIWISGQGYANSGADGRFFGATNHPNFIGMEMAVCAVVQYSLFANLTCQRKLKFVSAVLFTGSLIILALSGSRTAAVSLFAGLSVAFLVMRSRCLISGLGSWIYIALSISALLIGIRIVFFGFDEVMVNEYGRILSDDNTRQDVWKAMISAFFENPWIGIGRSPNSESSILKALATAGLMTGIPTIIFFAISVFKVWQSQDVILQAGNAYTIWASILFMLIIGSFFEGYLFESEGLMPALVMLSAAILGKSRNRNVALTNSWV